MKQLKDNIYYIGALNPNLRVFDIIMKTEFGTTYNAYLVKGEKTALIETVHLSFKDVYFPSIEEITAIKDIDYIVFNHTEPDHSGSLFKLLEINPDITVVGSTPAIKNLKNIANADFKSMSVKTGDKLDLGSGIELEFIISPNLHWPDSMFTYIKSLKTVFTCDFLGAHYCEPRLVDKDITYPDNYWTAFKGYYDAIFSPFKRFVIDGLNRLKELDFDMVCTSHGPILSENIKKCMDLYGQWSHVNTKPKTATIFYVSAYGYTQELANALCEELNANGVETVALDIIKHCQCEIEERIESSSAYLFGSPTINRDAVKPVWDVLSKIDPISNKGKHALIFGSYGWSGEACKNLSDRASGIGLKVFKQMPRTIFKPTQEDIKNLKLIAAEFAKTIS